MQIKKHSVLPAPLAGITNEPFRLALRSLGVKVTYTEMISCEGIVRNQSNTLNMLKLKKEKGNVVVQLFGSEPLTVYNAAKLSLSFGYKFIDINMGCPVKKVIKKGAGVSLMANPNKVKEIFSMLRNLPVYISAKIRLGTTKDKVNYLEIIKILYNEGVNAVTLHPRIGDEFFKKPAQWECIKEAKDRFPEFFIIGNGDINNPVDIERMFIFTNCDAVMVGREMCENPFIFKQWDEYTTDKNYYSYGLESKIIFFKTLFEYLKCFYDNRKILNLSKKYLFFLTKGLPHSGEFRKKLSKIKNCVEILNEISYLNRKYY
jgi:nifR3 family TIM-barrel protein